ncbi:MAG: TonB-dependent receptor [Acidobacteriaceae bacterium]|nr:TonB-dependent receptor [Acidobacteriaceae bacterium]
MRFCVQSVFSIVVACTATASTNLLFSQTAVGTLAGIVKDASGGRIQAASVSLKQISSSLQRESKTSSAGTFRIEDLQPGRYDVSVTAAGMSPARAEITVQVSLVQEITVTLQPASLRQTVTVEANASSITTAPLNPSSAVQGGVVTARDLRTLPLANRSFANVAYLVPGTEPVEPSDPTKARITAVSFGGSSGLNVQLSVDGGDDSDDYIGGFLQNFSVDAIQEFAVDTAQQTADVGRTTVGSVVITTKRGTNDWHGDAAFYERAAALNARFPIDNPAPNPKQPFSRQNYIGAVGGPIIKDRLWFFSSFEYVNENASIAYSPASTTQFNALASLASQGLIPGISSIGVPTFVPVPFRDYLSTFRIDWSQSERSQWFLRAGSDRYTTDNDLVQQGALPSTGATSRSGYASLVLNNQYIFTPNWLGTFTFNASGLHHTETRNQYLGFALAFPFSATSATTSGFETFGDNQFLTPITAFPVLRNQEKYQFRYQVAGAKGAHAPRLGIDFIHEPVLSGALSSTAENLTVFPEDPTFYTANPRQFSIDLICGPGATPGTTCTNTPESNGSFSQNVQRLGVYAEDSWRIKPNLTLNYGLRYDTTYGLFIAYGRSQLYNPALLTAKALDLPLSTAAPHDYRGAIAPRIGIAYSPGRSGRTVLRAGFGLFYNDLAQNGWVAAFQAVNKPPAVCAAPGDPGCLPGAALGGTGAVIDSGYKTPYAIHVTAGVAHSFNASWSVSVNGTHEEGVHAYRAYNYDAGYTLFSPLFAPDPSTQMAYVPNIEVFKSDNGSRYDALMVHLQGNLQKRLNMIVNYTYSKAETWGCVLGELFDYVNGVCNPLKAFGPGDYGPSGEDVRQRFVIAGTFYAPAGFQVSLLGQAETARPFTLTTPEDVNGFGNTTDDRAVVNGAQTALDGLRGTPYIQFDMRVSRPFVFKDRWSLTPFVEFFNLLNRNNPGANYVTSIAALPTPVNSLTNATAFCLNSDCTQTRPITSMNQLRVPAGAFGDFFGPGTTVGIPFAAQLGVRFSF